MKTRAIVIPEFGRVELRDIETPEPTAEQVLVETVCSAVSPGTEMRVLRGRQPGAERPPIIPGYLNVGRVVSGGDAAPGGLAFVTGVADVPGHCRAWGAHAAHVVCAAGAPLPIPAGVAPEHAVLAKLLAIAWRGVRMSRSGPGQRVLVAGLGVIGLLSARLHAMVGASVVAVDSVDGRVRRAASAGIEARRVEGELEAELRDLAGDGFDVAVESTGVPQVAAALVPLLRAGAWHSPEPGLGRLVIQASYEEGFALPYHASFLRELTVLVPRDHARADLADAMQFIAEGRLRVDDLAGPPQAPETAPQVYAAMAERRLDALTVVFRWR